MLTIYSLPLQQDTKFHTNKGQYKKYTLLAYNNEFTTLCVCICMCMYIYIYI